MSLGRKGGRERGEERRKLTLMVIENEEILSSSDVVSESRHVEPVVDAGEGQAGKEDVIRRVVDIDLELEREGRTRLTRKGTSEPKGRPVEESEEPWCLFAFTHRRRRCQRTREKKNDARRKKDTLTEIRKSIHVGRLVQKLNTHDVGNLDELLSKEGKDVDRLSHVGW